MEIIEKEVDFFKYCPTCKYRTLKETADPCNECLDNPMNVHTDKPVKYEAREKN